MKEAAADRLGGSGVLGYAKWRGLQYQNRMVSGGVIKKIEIFNSLKEHGVAIQWTFPVKRQARAKTPRQSMPLSTGRARGPGMPGIH